MISFFRQRVCRRWTTFKVTAERREGSDLGHLRDGGAQAPQDYDWRCGLRESGWVCARRARNEAGLNLMSAGGWS